MDMDTALETIETYCDNLQDIDIGENESKLHKNLRKLNTVVWSQTFDRQVLLDLALEIYEGYASISNKQPYTDIMRVVHYFENFFASHEKIELAPNKFRVGGMPMASLLRQLRQCA